MTQFKNHYISHEHDEQNKNIRNYWETPDWLFDTLDDVFNFTIDAAANEDNRKLVRYWGEDDDALSQSWEEEVVFCNPPTSDGEYGTWLDYAENQYLNHGATAAMVVPFKWETRGFDAVRNSARYILLPQRRIKFDPPDGVSGKSPTFYSCIAVFTWFEFSENELDILEKHFTMLDLTRGIIRR